MTLALIHGAASTSAVWDRVREHLYGIPVLVPNLPGRANVVWPPQIEGRDVAHYGEWLVRLMDEQGIDRATIAGHSLGGAIALWLALEHPDRVSGLALVATGARLRVTPALLDRLLDGLREGLDILTKMQFAAGTSDRDIIWYRRMVESCGWQTALGDFKACDRFDVMERLGEIRCPVQILAGDADVSTPVKYARYLDERIRVSRLTVYAGAGHALPLEHPAEIAGEMAVLWASTAPRTPTVDREASAASRDPVRGGR